MQSGTPCSTYIHQPLLCNIYPSYSISNEISSSSALNYRGFISPSFPSPVGVTREPIPYHPILLQPLVHEPIDSNRYCMNSSESFDQHQLNSIYDGRKVLPITNTDHVKSFLDSIDPAEVQEVRNIFDSIDLASVNGMEKKMSVEVMKSYLSSGDLRTCDSWTLNEARSIALMDSLKGLMPKLSSSDMKMDKHNEDKTLFESSSKLQPTDSQTMEPFVQKEMSSHDSFKFNQLSSCLNQIGVGLVKFEEDDDDDDEINEEVVKVENLDQLWDDKPAVADPIAPWSELFALENSRVATPNVLTSNVSHPPPFDISLSSKVYVPNIRETYIPTKEYSGEKKTSKFCLVKSCFNLAKTKGVCKHHGGGRRCKVESCLKSAQTGHLCIAHGGGKPCNIVGCVKTAQSRGLCKQHGGGVRCKFEGCTKCCQSGGFCRGHGGGKRCKVVDCTKWAQKNGHCAKHAVLMCD